MPATLHGKAVAARNATTHGLFARDIVLLTLGEDPDGYQDIQDQLTRQIQPQNLLEQHYVEKIAAASWRLRRLHRWQAQLFEDRALTEDQRLDKLDKVLRHETQLHRQIDSAVKMLCKDVPQLHQSRARAQALANTRRFEGECRRNPEAEGEVTAEVQRLLQPLTAAPPVAEERLDAVPTAQDLAEEAAAQAATEKCENERLRCQQQAAAKAERERERLLATLEHDVSDVHPDGRPVYVSVEDWEWMQEQRQTGWASWAEQRDADRRESFLDDQDEARALLAED